MRGLNPTPEKYLGVPRIKGVGGPRKENFGTLGVCIGVPPLWETLSPKPLSHQKFFCSG